MLPPRKMRVEVKEEAVDWDPDPADGPILITSYKAVLLEIIRRAAHDWVLYRMHHRAEFLQIAQGAYTWLFEEGPGHPWWVIRAANGRQLTAFLSICDALDLDPAFVRSSVRKLTVQQIMTAGRPAEKRKPREESEYEERASTTRRLQEVDGNGDIDYEDHFFVPTPEIG